MGGRVFECSLADLQGEKDAERSYRKFKLLIEEIQGKNCLTSFHGMNLTTDMLRLFCIGFTTKLDRSTKKTCYAQSSQIKNIRKKMVDIIQREVSSTDLKDVVAKLIPDSIASDIAKACQGIYPLHDVHIRKVKVLKRPRFDLTKLLDMHGEGSSKTVAVTDPTTGEVVERPEGYEPPVLDTV